MREHSRFLVFGFLALTLALTGCENAADKAAREKQKAQQEQADREHTKLISIAQSNLDSLKTSLIDPDSAKFDGVVLAGGDRVCGHVNSKNRMGGYVGRQAFVSGPAGVLIDDYDVAYQSSASPEDIETAKRNIAAIERRTVVMAACPIDGVRPVTVEGWKVTDVGPASPVRPTAKPVNLVAPVEPTQAAASVAAPTEDTAQYVSSIPRPFRGLWDEMTSDKCADREPRYVLKATTLSNFEVEWDVTRVKIESPTVIDIDATMKDEDGNQQNDTFSFRLADGGKALATRAKDSIYFRKCF